MKFKFFGKVFCKEMKKYMNKNEGLDNNLFKDVLKNLNL